ncbi:Alpha/Beta hydrolase protein, partial [Infundibulicybe gibba]
MSEGKIDFRVRGETFQTWYKVVGEITTNSRPLIVLHGGPGVTHSYLLAHTDLSKAYGIPLIFYDQVGNGQSTHILDKPKEFWSVDLFMDELDNLLAHFNIAGNFDLLGHSWGGMLAGSYATQRRPAGLKHLIITDSPASMPLWEESTAKL